jgi:hypothetical protein
MPRKSKPAPRAGQRAAQREAQSEPSEPLLDIEVLCTELPGIRFPDGCGSAAACYEPVHLGIQRGREVIDEVPADRSRATFTARFRIGRKRDGSPNFLGPYAQGPIDDRFFYLSWGVKRRTGPSAMFRRLKIRTGHLSWSDIERSQASGEPIRVTLRLTDARGAPLCATPPPSHIEWHLAQRSR